MPFLEFKALALGADRLTKQWTVESKDIPLGIVAWTTSWRRYTFYPHTATLYDAACLKEISRFLAEKTEEQKATWK